MFYSYYRGYASFEHSADFRHNIEWHPGLVLSYNLWYTYIVGFGLVEMAISTKPKPTIYHNLYENTSKHKKISNMFKKSYMKMFYNIKMLGQQKILCKTFSIKRFWNVFNNIFQNTFFLT